MIDALYVHGVGLWTPSFPDWNAWRRGAPSPAATPACAAFPARLLRGTSLVTRVALDVAAQAMGAAGVPLATTPTVFGSDLGEIQTAVAMIRAMTTEASPSPLRFKNSVHNAASGNLGIALENRSFTTSLSAGPDTVAMCLLEAWAWLDAEGGDAVVVVAEEDLPPPLSELAEAYAPLGVALCLGASADGRAPLATLRALRRTEARARVPEGFAGNAAAPLLGVLDAIARGETGVVALSTAGGGWSVDVAARRGS